jgi:hypothetical protein
MGNADSEGPMCLTNRDYFAAKAMAALMSWHGEDSWKTIRPFSIIAQEAYSQADAMLAAREGK